jgi:hypothetical protein
MRTLIQKCGTSGGLADALRAAAEFVAPIEAEINACRSDDEILHAIVLRDGDMGGWWWVEVIYNQED